MNEFSKNSRHEIEESYEHGPDELENEMLEEKLEMFTESFREDQKLEGAEIDILEEQCEMYEPMTEADRKFLDDLWNDNKFKVLPIDFNIK